MGKYQSDTESESYRYDDSNNSSDESVTDLDIPDFNDKNAIQIAEYLDKKLHQDINKKTSEIAIGTDSSGQQKTFQSPLVEKLWAPLSQSTPTDLPKNRAQPKDILKAKSKLSKLSVNANDSNLTTDEDEDDYSHTGDPSTSPSFNDETPSKSSKKKSTTQGKQTKKHEAESKELQELRELKQYLANLPNGNLLLENFKISEPENSFKIVKQEEIIKNEQEMQSLTDQVNKFQNQNSALQEEIFVLKSSNSDLKENIEIKTDAIQDLKTKLEDSTEKVGDSQTVQKEMEETLQELEMKFKKLFGDSEQEVTPEKYPALNILGTSGKPLYDELELQMVDSLSLVKSHNTIKNILINLQIPFSETKQTIPKIARLLQDEDVLCEFANKLHTLLYKRNLKISRFQNESNGNEHLKQCTTQMYRNFEILFNSSTYSQL